MKKRCNNRRKRNQQGKKNFWENPWVVGSAFFLGYWFLARSSNDQLAKDIAEKNKQAALEAEKNKRLEQPTTEGYHYSPLYGFVWRY